MRPSEKVEVRRRRKAQLGKYPAYAKAAFEVVNMAVLPPNMADWPEGLAFMLNKAVECAESLALQLGRDPIVAEVAVELCRRRFLELTIAVNTELAGVVNPAQSTEDPEPGQPTESPDQNHAEAT